MTTNFGHEGLTHLAIPDSVADQRWPNTRSLASIGFRRPCARHATDKTLQRLVATTKLHRVDRGLYDRPIREACEAYINGPLLTGPAN